MRDAFGSDKAAAKGWKALPPINGVAKGALLMAVNAVEKVTFAR